MGGHSSCVALGPTSPIRPRRTGWSQRSWRAPAASTCSSTTLGSIVNTGSIEGLGANPNHAAYCATRSGLHRLTRAVAVDHGHEGIRFNAMTPGWIDTVLTRDVAEGADPEAFARDIGRIHPVGRADAPDDVD